jgi:sugar lactone lactonase YvrE
VVTGAQDIYAAPVPDLPPCAQVQAGTPCSPTTADQIPLPNDIVFDPAGNAYVTDSFQATIFRIPPGGGQPQIWFQDPRLDGIVGPNGIRLSLDRQHLYFTVSFSTQAAGFVYSLPLIAQPTAADLGVFHQYATEGPDDLALGRSGKVYVSLAVTNQISVLDPLGNELTRYAGPATDGLPLDSPSGVAFGGRSLLVNNHALFSQKTQDMALLSIFVNERAAPLVRPRLP